VTHPRLSLDPVIHAPVRLSIVAALAAVDEADFASLRETLQVSDSLLSKQSSALEEAGYLKIRKAFVGKRPRTYLSLTATGRKALAVHLKALRELTGMASDPADSSSD